MKAEELITLVGVERPPSAWLKITQERIHQFAEASDDHQFIHVNPAKAAATPFGGTIAHGFLTLSLLPALAEETSPEVDGLVMGINYGLNKVRFMQPVKTGNSVRTRQKLLQVVQRKPGHWMLKTEHTMEIQGEDKPALIAETIVILIVK